MLCVHACGCYCSYRPPVPNGYVLMRLIQFVGLNPVQQEADIERERERERDHI